MPVAGGAARMERHGVLIDAPLLARQSRENWPSAWWRLEQAAYAIAGQPFNLGSPQADRRDPVRQAGPAGEEARPPPAPSTDEDVLQELAADYPLPARILDHRSLSKLKGTYTDKLPLMVNPATGRVHTNYAQAVAVTGRLSSNDPNLQNIPIRTPEGRRVREAFVAPPGHVIASADYSQIELRIMAHISGDPACCAPSPKGWTCTAPPPAEGVRRAGGAGDVGAAALCQGHQLRPHLRHGRVRAGAQPRHRAARPRTTSTAYFQRFAGVRRYMDETKRRAKERAMSRPCSAAACGCPRSTPATATRAARAERQAINAPMQGTAADLIKLAMMACSGRSTGAGHAAW